MGGRESGRLQSLSSSSERCMGVNRAVTIIKWWQRAVGGRESGRLQSLSGGSERWVGINRGGYNP